MTERHGSHKSPASDPVFERLRRPIHFGTLLGLSAGVYATTLTGVAVLQQQADDDLAAARAPAAAHAVALRAANDELAATIRRLDQGNATAASSYATARGGIDTLESDLEVLAAIVAEVKGAAAALPERIALPAVPSVSVRLAARPPVTHATTGASGG